MKNNQKVDDWTIAQRNEDDQQREEEVIEEDGKMVVARGPVFERIKIYYVMKLTHAVGESAILLCLSAAREYFQYL